jgi:Protein of unknown function (DUF3168)
MANGDGPELDLQAAIVKQLKADPLVASLVNGRIYDQVPSMPSFPYISIGPVDMQTDDADCITGFSLFQQLDVWSRDVGFPECKKIMDAARVALHDQEAVMPLANHAMVFLEHRSTREFRDPDGLTSHGVLSFEASIERQPPPIYP